MNAQKFLIPKQSNVFRLITLNAAGEVIFFGAPKPAKIDPSESATIIPPGASVLITGIEDNVLLVKNDKPKRCCR